MSFAKLEESVLSGRPIQLYQFSRTSGGLTFYWLYNTSDRDLTYLEGLFTATAISDDGVRQTGEATTAEYKVTLPITEQFCADYRAGGASPSDSIYLRMYRVHADDITDIDTAPVVTVAQLLWVGTVDGMTQTNDLTAEVNCSTLSVSFKRGGLRYTWQKNCPHVLYAPLTCKANKDDFRVTDVVSAIEGNKITCDSLHLTAEDYLTGGYLEYYLPSGFLERRMITLQAGDVMTVTGTVVGLSVGDTFNAYAGCKRTVDDCINKFNNYPNYGGFPHSPGRNPFDGQPVF